MLCKEATTAESFFNAFENDPKERGCSACGQEQNLTVWQALKSSYPKRLSWVAGTGAQLSLSAIAVDSDIWLWPLLVQNGGWWKLCVTPGWHGDGLRWTHSGTLCQKIME